MKYCDLEYTPYANGNGTVVSRCVPRDGVYLYEISATYSNSRKCTKYYYLGRSQKEALDRFRNRMTWMIVKNVRMIPPGEEAESILTDKFRMPLR